MTTNVNRAHSETRQAGLACPTLAGLAPARGRIGGDFNMPNRC